MWWCELGNPSRHRKAQRLAANRHVDGGKTGRGEATGAAVALVIDLELVLARAERHHAAPVEWLVLELDSAVFGIDGFREAENFLRLTADVGMQAFAGVDGIPPP